MDNKPEVAPPQRSAFAPPPPSTRNFGPANDSNIQLARTNNGGKYWNWVVYLKIKAGQKVQYTFEFAADNENEMVLYELGGWNRIPLQRINNYDFQLPGHAWDFQNGGTTDVYHVLSGWHKNTSPSGGEPWWQSPAYYNNGNATQLVVGFADNWYDPPFGNGKITILRSSQDAATPYYHEEVPLTLAEARSATI